MYRRLFESYVLWWRSKPWVWPIFHARLGFSALAFINLVSATRLLNTFAGIPVLGWVSDHRWSIWAAMVLVAAPHWLIARNIGSKPGRTEADPSSDAPSRFLWLWYSVPVVAIFVGTMVLARVSGSLPPY